MTGILNDRIRDEFYKGFHDNCIILIGDACQNLKDRHVVTINWDEETISASIFTYIDKSSKAAERRISISNEYRLYGTQVLKGMRNAKNTPRIDFRFDASWHNVTKVEFFVEAKNLIQNVCHKQNNKKDLNPKQIQKRYIKTGIQRYTTNYYPSNGCMLGYVLEGDVALIVDSINSLMDIFGRSSELLKQDFCPFRGIDGYYKSHHGHLFLEHYFVKF